MGIDTKGIVTKATHVNLFEVAQVMQTALKPFTYNTRLGKGKGSITVEVSPWGKHLSVHFQVQGDELEPGSSRARRLMVFFDCQSDHPEYGEDHLGLVIGHWGDSVEIMKAATTALANLANESGEGAKAFVLNNDAISDMYTEVKVAAPV